MARKLLVTMGVLGLVLLTASCTPAPAPTPAPTPAPAPAPESAEEFYKKNTVTLIVPNPAGGGVDYAGRLFSSFWSEVTGGTIIVKNMPGTGGIAGTNFVYESKPDGLTMGVGVMGGALVAPVLFGDTAVRFDPRKFNWIGLIGESKYVFTISSKLRYESMAELQEMEGFRFGATAPSNDAGLASTLLIEFFQLKNARIVTGYTGTAEIGLALGRGEIDGHCYQGSIARDNIDKGWGKTPPLVVFDTERASDWPDTPALPELIQLSPQQEGLFAIVRAVMGGRPFFLPPGVPEDRVKFMRGAFDEMVKLDGFIRMGKMAWPEWIEPMKSEELTKFFDVVFTIPKGDVDKLLELNKKYAR